MARKTRVFQKLFGSTAPSGKIGKFGSFAGGSPATTTDPVQVQSLSQFLEGWTAAVLGNNSPTIEDMNALFFLCFYQLAYLFEAGVPEWDDETTYYIGDLINVGGQLYKSKVDNNLNHDPSVSPTQWGAQGLEPTTRMLFYQATAPLGWTRDTSVDNKFLRVVSAGSPGTTGGTHAANINIGSHTHAGPSHTHTSDAHVHSLDSDAWARWTHDESVDTIYWDRATVNSWDSDRRMNSSGGENAGGASFTQGIALDGFTNSTTPGSTGASGTANTGGTSLGSGSYAYADVIIATKD